MSVPPKVLPEISIITRNNMAPSVLSKRRIKREKKEKEKESIPEESEEIFKAQVRIELSKRAESTTTCVGGIPSPLIIVPFPVKWYLV